jgi:hypothetical protein
MSITKGKRTFFFIDSVRKLLNTPSYRVITNDLSDDGAPSPDGTLAASELTETGGEI